MVRVIFRKATATGTRGVWLAQVDEDLREFCPKAYRRGVSYRKSDFHGFSINYIAFNVSKYSLQIFWET